MADLFEAGVEATKLPMDPTLLESYTSNLFMLEEYYPETKERVQSCIKALQKPNVTVLDALIATFVINEGLAIKYDLPNQEEPDTTIEDFEKLLANIKDEPEEKF